jgi:hypothetical protein
MNNRPEIITEVIDEIMECECLIPSEYFCRNYTKREYGLKLLEVLTEELKRRFDTNLNK